MRILQAFTEEQLQHCDARFWGMVDTSGDCWLWHGARTRKGYGVFTVYALQTGTVTTMSGHRYAFIRANGWEPESTDHLCPNKLCVRPTHLEGVTSAENTRRKPRKQFCNHGHPLTLDNLYIYRSKTRMHRSCRTCRRERNRIYWAGYSGNRSAVTTPEVTT